MNRILFEKTLKIVPAQHVPQPIKIGNIRLNQFLFPLNPDIEPFPT